MRGHLERRQDWIKGRREKRKQARYARIRRQVLRYTLLLLLTGLCISGFFALSWKMADCQTDIEIHGNQVVVDDQIRRVLSDYCQNKPIYNLDPRHMERLVAGHLGAVRYAFVRRYLVPRPHLVVEVLEEFPWASFSPTPEGKVEAVISQTGRVISVAEFPAIVQPQLKIAGNSMLHLSAKEVAQWDGWVNLIAAQTGREVEVIDLRQPASVKVKVGDLNLHLGTCDSSLTRRLNRLASVVPVIASLKNKVEYIDLSLDSNIPLKIDRHEQAVQPAQQSTDEAGAPTAEAATSTAEVTPQL